MVDLKIEVDNQLAKEASKVFEDMGLNSPTAIRCFLKKSIEVGEFPFDVNFNKDTPDALKEVEEDNLTTFENFDEFWQDINSEIGDES